MGSLAADQAHEQATLCVVEVRPASGVQSKDSTPLAGLREEVCPVCLRTSTLLRAGDTLFCAACGYASEGASGCT